MGFSRHKIQRSSAYTISEKAIRFRHADYDPDRAQKLISSSMSRHLSTRKMSSKSMHAFLSNLANRQTDRQTDKHREQSHLPPPLSEVNYPAKIYQLSFFDNWIRFVALLRFVKLGQKRKWPFWTSLQPPKEFRNQKLNFSIAAHLPSSWKIWWRSASQFWRYREQNNKKISEK